MAESKNFIHQIIDEELLPEGRVNGENDSHKISA
jgi:hypothetical protein